MVWIKRSVFSFKFKGRERRGLYWSKKVYQLWFEFAKVSPRNVPDEFGDLSQFKTFEEWWRHPDYGFELFCEPAEEDCIQMVNTIGNESAKDGIVYLRINLNEEPQKLKVVFRSFLKKHQKPQPVVKESRARFRPSTQQKNMKMYAWSEYLEIWKLRQSGLSRVETYEKKYNRKWEEDDFDSLRCISRATQRANEIFKNIEKGTFP